MTTTDTARAQALGWHPQTQFAAGMAATVAWYREHRPWWEPIKSGAFWDFYQRNYRPRPLASA